jgi:IS30 family transposase
LIQSDATERWQRRWTEAEESQLREMLDAGMKVPKIARKLNRTAQAILQDSCR